MKKLLSLALTFLVCLSFSACKNQDETKIVSFPTDEEVFSSYEKATEISNWFNVAALNRESENAREENVPNHEEDGFKCYKAERFETVADFKNYVNGYFSQELTESFFKNSKDIYFDIDGLLFTSEGARGTNIFMGEEKLSTKKESDTKILLTAEVELLDFDDEKGELLPTGETESFQFAYENIDGSWVFTSFPVIR